MIAELATGSVFAGYRIDGVLGRGGMGVVYRAYDPGLERPVALKLIAPEVAGDPRFRERFLRETRIAAALEHPHILPVHAAGERDGSLFLAMRFVEGEDLASRLAREGPLKAQRALEIAGELAGALDAAHARGLVHRDVKPGNVLVASSGESYLCDFGLTKRVSSQSGLTATGEFVGTIDYLAPEQIRSQPLDGKADQYALACLLFECVAGEPPFRRDGDAQTLWAHMNDVPPALSEKALALPAALDPVLRRGLAKSPGERYESCIALIEAAESAVRARPGAHPGEPAPPAAAPPAPEPITRETRKTVTVLFATLAPSTDPGAQVDLEAQSRLTTRACREVGVAIERHGGTVVTLAGEAVTAVFGIPAVHEDDTLRAVRAAEEARSRLLALEAEARSHWSVRLDVRFGISTGEVIVGGEAGSLRATGGPLTAAARLGHAAEPGAIALDEGAHRLVRSAVEVEAAGAGFRLVAVHPGIPAHVSRFDSPMVGRQRERRRLHDAFEQAVADRSSQLFTVLGAAGVGKSRLVQELLSDLAGQALVARGRCLPYGEGITYWPVMEAVREAAGFDEAASPAESRRRLAGLLEGEEQAELIAQRLAGMIGLSDVVSGPEESFGALCCFFEALARSRPLVLVFDDIHWGEATFLDLVEHVADWAREAPILLVCLARPELLEARPGWGGGKLNATSVLLEPLSEEESTQLVENLSGADLEEADRARIVVAAEGNPLFVEEMLAFALDTAPGGQGLTVPPTIQALLAARLDRLSDDERSVIEVASVEGDVFHEGSVVELVPEGLRPSVGEHLTALVRKELLRPGRSEFSDDRAYRFRHLLIRDAAYESIPKEARAALHERHAAWLESKTQERAVEWEEILGYHLERALRYRAELGTPSDADRELARRAADKLAAAGRRAFLRRDSPAAVNLFSRAVSLLPPDDPARVELVPTVHVARGGDLDWAVGVLDEAIAAGDAKLSAHALVQRGFLRLYTSPDVTAGELIETAEGAIDVFDGLGDDLGLARAWRLVAQANYLARRAGATADATERALVHARHAGDRFEELENLEWLGILLVLGPVPAAEGARRCERLLDEAAGDPVFEANALGTLAYMVAIQGRTSEAQELLARGVTRALGEGVWFHPVIFLPLTVWAGDPKTAELELRPGYDALGQAGEKSNFSTLAIVLAQAVYAQGRYEEAEALAREGREAALPAYVYDWTISQTVMAKVLARRGELEAAEQLAREGIAFVDQSDFITVHAEALADLAEILRLAGRSEEAGVALEEAIRLWEQKGNVVAAARAGALHG